MIIKLISEPLCNGTREAASKNEFTFADASPASAHSTTREKNCGMCTANFNYAFAILHCVYFVKSSNRQRLLIENPSFSFTWSTEFWEFGTDNVSRLSRFYSTDSCVPLSLSLSPQSPTVTSHPINCSCPTNGNLLFRSSNLPHAHLSRTEIFR